MKRQSFPAEGELTEEKLVNVHAHSRDSSAHETTLAHDPQRGRRPENGAVKHPSRGRIDREKANECHVHSQDSWAHEATLAHCHTARAEA